MRRPLYTVILADLVFFLLLILSGSVSGLGSRVIYFLAFLIPTAIGIFAIRRGACDENHEILRLDSPKILPSLPLVFPTVLAVMTLSFVTTLAFGDRMAYFVTSDVGDDLAVAILSHAVLPAVLEEILFRYIPVKLLAPYSPRYAVILSALFFALIHHSAVSIPYALLAGLVLGGVTVAYRSILPAVIIHFVNNLASVLSLCLAETIPEVNTVIWALVGGLAALSLIPIVIRRKKYASELRAATEMGEGYDGGLAPVAIAVPTLMVAAAELYAVLTAQPTV